MHKPTLTDGFLAPHGHTQDSSPPRLRTPPPAHIQNRPARGAAQHARRQRPLQTDTKQGTRPRPTWCTCEGSLRTAPLATRVESPTAPTAGGHGTKRPARRATPATAVCLRAAAPPGRCSPPPPSGPLPPAAAAAAQPRPPPPRQRPSGQNSNLRRTVKSPSDVGAPANGSTALTVHGPPSARFSHSTLYTWRPKLALADSLLRESTLCW